ncbi:hypothetical protein [Brevibacterium senegalense]|uniref:hypothetical protein n=1 Tax=Brevibacterium senegalense TaxID=1033736 RepID=UPI0002FCDC5C|nr:hypothetical protein [Brevibacterium senegalense]
MTTNSSGERRSFATVADRLVGLKDPSMGDERERDIILRAGTTAMTVSIFTIQTLGVLLAVIGVGLWSGVVLAAAVIPGVAYTWYCQSSGLDTTQSYAKIAARRRNWSVMAGLAMAAAWIGALSFHMLTGSPLVQAGIQGTVGTGNSTAIGLVVGGLIGGTIGVFTLSRSSRAGAKRNAADDEDDED